MFKKKLKTTWKILTATLHAEIEPFQLKKTVKSSVVHKKEQFATKKDLWVNFLWILKKNSLKNFAAFLLSFCNCLK